MASRDPSPSAGGASLDTTGMVYPMEPRVAVPGGLANAVKWIDLSPFAQGYVEAMFASLHGRMCGAAPRSDGYIGARRVDTRERGPLGCSRRATAMEGASFLCGQHAKNPATVLRKSDGKMRGNARPIPVAFSDLAPETLAAILKDCEAREGLDRCEPNQETRRRHGRQFWIARQNSSWPASFPPLTVYLGDDGKVRTQAIADTSERNDLARDAKSLNPQAKES